MSTRLRYALGLFGLAGVAAAATLPRFTVLLRTGDRAADGLGIATVGPPVAGAAGELFFSGTTGAVLEADGGTLKTVVSCGDSLPAPLAGTFGTFSQPIINDAGVIAFVASLNSPSATNGLFLRDGTSWTTVSLAGGAAEAVGPGTGAFDINGHGDVVALGASGVSLWTRATGQTTSIADATSAEQFTGRPVIGDGGQAAWIGIPRRRGRVGGVYTRDPTSGVVPVVEEGSRTTGSSPFRRANVAINAAGQVAFVVQTSSSTSSVSGAFVWDPHTRTRQRIAARGSVVGGEQLDAFGHFIGIDGQGTVVFLARFASGTRLVRAAGGTLTALAYAKGGNFPARLPDTGQVVWIVAGAVVRFDGHVGTVVAPGDQTPVGTVIDPSDPSVNAAGTVVFNASRAALYRLAGGVATAVLKGGDPLPGGGTIATTGAYTAGSKALAVFANTADGVHVLARRTVAGLDVIAAAGDPSPLGGTFDLLDEVVAAGGSRVAFRSTTSAAGGAGSAAGVFVAGAGKRVRVVARQGAAAPRGGHFASFGALAVGGSSVVFEATLAGDLGTTALFRNQHRRTIRIASMGQMAPDGAGHVFAWFGPIAASADRVLFVAGMETDTVPPGLFLWTRGTLTRLRTDATDAGPVAVPFVFDGPIALAGHHAFVAGDFGAGEVGIYLARRRQLRALVTNGEALPTGGTLGLGNAADGSGISYAVSPRGDRLTLAATVGPGGVLAALLERAVGPR